jgi:hypothetical protein
MNNATPTAAEIYWAGALAPGVQIAETSKPPATVIKPTRLPPAQRMTKAASTRRASSAPPRKRQVADLGSFLIGLARDEPHYQAIHGALTGLALATGVRGGAIGALRRLVMRGPDFARGTLEAYSRQLEMLAPQLGEDFRAAALRPLYDVMAVAAAYKLVTWNVTAPRWKPHQRKPRQRKLSAPFIDVDRIRDQQEALTKLTVLREQRADIERQIERIQNASDEECCPTCAAQLEHERRQSVLEMLEGHRELVAVDSRYFEARLRQLGAPVSDDPPAIPPAVDNSPLGGLNPGTPSQDVDADLFGEDLDDEGVPF